MSLFVCMLGVARGSNIHQGVYTMHSHRMTSRTVVRFRSLYGEPVFPRAAVYCRQQQWSGNVHPAVSQLFTHVTMQYYRVGSTVCDDTYSSNHDERTSEVSCVQKQKDLPGSQFACYKAQVLQLARPTSFAPAARSEYYTVDDDDAAQGTQSSGADARPLALAERI